MPAAAVSSNNFSIFNPPFNRFRASMANEMMILQARSEEYASALSRAQSQLVEKESHVLHLQSREALLLLEREALLREVNPIFWCWAGYFYGNCFRLLP
jgi:hypothetical protein